MFTRQLELSSDEDLTALATAALPGMQEHLQTVQTLLDSMHLGSTHGVMSEDYLPTLGGAAPD